MKNIKDKLSGVALSLYTTLLIAATATVLYFSESAKIIEPVYRGDLNRDGVLDALVIEPTKDSSKGPFQIKYVNGNDIYLSSKGSMRLRKSPTGNFAKIKDIKPIRGGFTKVNPEKYKTYDIISTPDGGFAKVNPKSSLYLEVKDVNGDGQRDIVFYKNFNPRTLIDILYNIDEFK